MAQLISNTDKVYECVSCGSTNVSVIRQSPDPRLKCGTCSFMFNGSQSEAAMNAGAIPESSAEALAEADLPEQISHTTGSANKQKQPSAPFAPFCTMITQPRSPTHVFLSKDRTNFEFASKSTLKKVALKWEQGLKYDLYELVLKQSAVKLEIT